MIQTIYLIGLFAIPALLYFGVSTWREPTKPALVIPALLWILLSAYLSWRMAFPPDQAGQAGCSILAYSCPPQPTGLAFFVAILNHAVKLVLMLSPIGVGAWIGAHFGAKRRFQ
ncbi:MAG: hypothetical protein PHI71_07120 [Acidiphilium sp.]|nr:hypothetical protein [Acidiphilium sp.]